MAKKVTINYAQQRKVEAILRECLTVSDDGFCHYNGEANDTSVADNATRDFGFQCNDTNVAHVRLLVFGKLRSPSRPPGQHELADLEARVARLEHEISALAKVLMASTEGK